MKGVGNGREKGVSMKAFQKVRKVKVALKPT